jgi:hypothetical protein
MSTPDLKAFCATAPSRPYLHHPFGVDAYTCATDGRVAILVPRQEDLHGTMPPPERTADRVREFIAGADVSFSPAPDMTLPAPPVPEEEECEDCEGRGKEHTCPDCECACETCSGTGVVLKVETVSTTIGGAILDVALLRRVAGLPALEFGPTDTGGGAVYFRFSGGFGLIMPRTRKADRHISVIAEPATVGDT